MPISPNIAKEVIFDESRITNYMTRFQCLCDGCDDCCCRDWMIALDASSYRQLQKVLEHHEPYKHLLSTLVFDPKAAETTDKYHGYIRMTEENVCPFLDKKGLCSIHLDFGETSLCTQCSVFPRSTLMVNNNLEIGGSLACPEVARLALLSSDGLVYQPMQTSMLPRHFIGHRVNAESYGIYSSYFEEIRSALIHTLLLPDFPFSARLVFLANFADRIHEVFQKKQSLSNSRRILADRLIAREITLLYDSIHLKNLAGEFNEFVPSRVHITSLLESILFSRTSLPHSSRYATIVRDTLHSYHRNYADPTNVNPNFSNTAMEEIYNCRRDFFQYHFGKSLDQIYTNYAVHFFLVHPYTESESLLQYLCMLKLRIAAIHFLLMGHSEVTSLFYRPSALTFEESKSVLEHAAIEVIQTFTKAIDHYLAFLATIDSALVAQAPHSLARALCLARFYEPPILPSYQRNPISFSPIVSGNGKLNSVAHLK
jgi:lysine-N-methylase